MQSDEFARAVAVAAKGRSADANRDLAVYDGDAPFTQAPPAGRYSTRVLDYVVDQSNVSAVFQAANTAAAWIVSQLGSPCGAELSSCLRPLVEERGAVLFGRPLDASEIDSYVAVGTDLAPTLGSSQATEAVFEALLRAPQFLYRMELGNGAGELTPLELAHAISYGLTGGPADRQLWDAAKAGTLSDPSAVRAQVERLMSPDDPRSPFLRFLEEFAQFDDVVDVNKDQQAFPFHDAEALRSDARRSLQAVFVASGRQDFLRQLLTYTSGFVSPESAETYGISMPPAADPALTAFPIGTRSGFLTSPAWLVAHAEHARNNAIKRGRFVRTELLCGVVPPIPITLDIKALPDEPSVPMRQVLSEHSIDPSCAGCHQLMDPLGLTFEMYDHLGRERTQEFGAAIDASGELVGSGDQDGPVTNAIDLSQRLADSSGVAQCFTKQTYQYFVGRDPGSADGCAINAAYEAFRAHQDVVDLVAAIFSPATYGRRQGPSP